MKYISPFSMNELFAISGQPGVWRIKTVITTMRVVVMYRLTKPTQTVNAKMTDVIALDMMRLPTTHVERISAVDGFSDPNVTNVTTVVERIWDKMNSGTIIDVSNFDNIDQDNKKAFMCLLVPDADLNKFPVSLFSKICKWSMEIFQAIDMLEIVIDPYDLEKQDSEFPI